MTQSALEWFRSYSGWLALALASAGFFGLGFGAGTTQSQATYLYQRGQLTQAYRVALDAKDQIIAQLAHSTVAATQQASVATGQAADATAQAADAAAQAADAATRAAVAADAKQLKKLQ